MAYSDNDLSISDGAPVEFYKFTGELGEYYYTNDNIPHTYAGNTYLPEPITRTAIEVTSVLDSIVTVDIILPFNNELIMLYNFLKMPVNLDVEIYRWHRGTTIATETKRIWSGVAVGFPVEDNRGKISTQSALHAKLSNSTNQIICQSQCNHILYDSRCKVVEADFTWSATVTRIRGSKITVDNDHNADGNLKLGKLVIDRTGENRIITDNVNNVVTVVYDFIDIVVGDTIKLIAGCDKSYTTCLNNFNNIENFGGFKWLPSDNPFVSGI